jgi:geranylgeranyl pyrophosphate synthase
VAQQTLSALDVAEAERLLRRLAARLAAQQPPIGRRMADFVTGFLDRIDARGSRRAAEGMVALPLLVHAAEAGDPRPAHPIAAVHLLWWAAARHLDDLVDARSASAQSPSADQPATGSASASVAIELNAQTLTSIAVGCHLARELLADSDPRLLHELSRCWLDAINGQLMDLAADPGATALDDVLASYRGKTGAPYAMAAAMAAVAAGCDDRRVDAWRDFGMRFGVLRQLVNDQRDLDAARHEDLRNRTATYLLVHYLESAPAQEHAAAMALLDASPVSAPARDRLAARLLDPVHVYAYADSLAPLIEGLHSTVDVLCGVSPSADGLHTLVAETATWFPRFHLGGRAGHPLPAC